MSQKNCLSALAAFFGIVALMFAVPSVSHATASARRSDLSRDQSPGIVVAENDQSNESADADSDSESDSKDSDDETTAEDKDDSNDGDQTEQQSAGNAQVAPQFQNGDNDASDAGKAGQAPVNPYPQQINPYQANPYQ
jgi:hypothetical protein